MARNRYRTPRRWTEPDRIYREAGILWGWKAIGRYLGVAENTARYWHQTQAPSPWFGGKSPS